MKQRFFVLEVIVQERFVDPRAIGDTLHSCAAESLLKELLPSGGYDLFFRGHAANLTKKFN